MQNSDEFRLTLRHQRATYQRKAESLKKELEEIEAQISAIDTLLEYGQTVEPVKMIPNNFALDETDYPDDGSIIDKVEFALNYLGKATPLEITRYISAKESYDEEAEDKLYATVGSYFSRWVKEGKIGIVENRGKQKVYTVQEVREMLNQNKK